MLILAFHRSLSSSLANWLHHAGLDMGHYLMPPAVSNPEGHHEDMLLVDLHDRLLRMNGTDWRFHDSAPFDPAIRQDLLQRYVEHRTATTAGPWGMKDPRTCLFLPAWRQVLGTQGRYLVLLRHWSGSVQSLYRRHSQALAVGSGNTMLHASFWQQPEQAARMWLACQRRVLALLEHAREQCLVVTQQALLAGLPVIDSINTRFGLALNPQTPSPIRHSLAHDRMEESIRERLSPALLDQLEALWQRLLQAADHRAGNESPCWVPDRSESAQELLQVASTQSATAAPTLLTGNLQRRLKTLADDPALPLDTAHWQQRIEHEARFVPECWELLGRAQLSRGDALGAERHLTRVLLCGRSPAYLFHLLGTCREAELDHEGAEHFHRQAIARNDGNPAFHVRLCRLWLTDGRYEEAEHHLIEALLRHPGKPPLLHALATCLDQQGQTSRAIALLEQQPALPLLLNRQLLALRMKQDPVRAEALQAPLDRASAATAETQRAVIQALASIDDTVARHDLARRIALVWKSLDVAMDPSATRGCGAPASSEND